MKPLLAIVCAPAVLPDFDAWLRMKQQCMSCANVLREKPFDDAAGQTGVLRCAAAPIRRSLHPFCLDWRTSGECGPHAKEFRRA